MEERISAYLYTSDDGSNWRPMPGIPELRVSAYAPPRLGEGIMLRGQQWRIHDIVWHVKNWQASNDDDSLDMHIMPDGWTSSLHNEGS